MILSKKAVAAYLNRRVDNHLWMKKLPKQQLYDEARRMKVRPIFRTDPWTHQLVCWWLCLQYPQFMMALTMGAGKTKIMSDVLTQLIRERRVRRGLVIVPTVINVDTWNNDLYAHSDLEPTLIDTSDTEEKRERFHHPRGDLTIIDMPSLQWVLCKKEKVNKKKNAMAIDQTMLERARSLYDFVGVDETHRLSNADSLWWSMVDKLCATANYSYGATGTLFDTDIQEAWTQMRIIDQGLTFGENIGLFRAAFMDKVVKPWKGEVWTASKAMAPQFHETLQHRSINYEEDELFDLPKRRYVPMTLRMGEEQRDHYLRALDGVINAGGNVGELDSQWFRMRQITSGYLAWKDGTGDHKLVFADNPKLAALERVLEELGSNKKIIVCHDYVETGELITEFLKKMGVGHVWYYGGTKDKIATKNKFLDERSTQVMVANSRAIGTGTDGLQKVCRYMVFYESPTPPKERVQTEKRIHRPGMDDALRPYYYDLVCRNTVDAGIRAGHQEGYDFYAEFMSGRTKGRGYLIGRN